MKTYSLRDSHHHISILLNCNVGKCGVRASQSTSNLPVVPFLQVNSLLAVITITPEAYFHADIISGIFKASVNKADSVYRPSLLGNNSNDLTDSTYLIYLYHMASAYGQKPGGCESYRQSVGQFVGHWIICIYSNTIVKLSYFYFIENGFFFPHTIF